MPFPQKLKIFVQVWKFSKNAKRFWLAPLIFFLLIIGMLLIFAEGSAFAPLIYTIF